jgi:hypothetical protein
LTPQEQERALSLLNTLTEEKPQPPKFRGANLAIQTYAGEPGHVGAVEVILHGPAECLAGETLIFDPMTKKSTPIKELAENGEPITVLTVYGPRRAEAPFKKGTAALYRVTMKSGASFLATARHRVLTANGWDFVQGLSCGDVLPLSAPVLQASNSDIGPQAFQQDARRSFQTAQDWKSGYSVCLHPYGGQLLEVEEGDQDVLPLRGDVRGRSHAGRNSDALVALSARSHRNQSPAHLSSADYFPKIDERAFAQNRAFQGTGERVSCLCQSFEQFQQGQRHPQPTASPLEYGDSRHRHSRRSTQCRAVSVLPEPGLLKVQDSKQFAERLVLTGNRQQSDAAESVLSAVLRSFPYSEHYTVHLDTVSSVEFEREDDFYDMHVPGAEHYLAEGFWHHNTGKTWAALWRLDQLLRDNPGEHGVLARKIQSTLWGTVLVTWARIQEVRKALGEAPAEPYGGNKPEFYDYANGSRLWVGGMDNSQKILSGERGVIYFNQAEEFELKDWETCLSRVTGRGSKMKPTFLFGDANPGPEDHWIMKRAEIAKFQSKHVDNPTLYDDGGNILPQGEASIRTLQSLTGIRRSRLYLGEWVGAEGLFFETWDDAQHVCKPFPIPGDWPIWGAFDYGFSHNTAFGLYTEHDGTIYKIWEHVRHGWLPPFHAAAIHRGLQKLGIDRRRLRTIVAGHDVFQVKGDENGRTIAQQYADAVHPETGDAVGLRFEKANIARIPGAAELLTRLGNQEMGIKPTLKFFDTCLRTIACFKRMVKDPREGEDVLKVDSDASGQGGDDAYDETRYGVMFKQRGVSVLPASIGGQSKWGVGR